MYQGNMDEVKIMGHSKVKGEKIMKEKSISSNGSIYPNEENKGESSSKKKGKQTSPANQKPQNESVINGSEL
jgi:hypothetical protein